MILLLQPYVMLEDGTVKFLEPCGSGCYQGEDVRLWVTYREGAEATAVEVRAQSGRPFHPDCAVGLLIKQIDHLQEYVTASSPYSDYNCWYAPQFETDLTQVKPMTQSLLWKTEDDSYGMILCMSDGHFKSEMKGTEQGLEILLFDWFEGERALSAPVCMLAEGENPFCLGEACVREGMKLLGKSPGGRQDRSYPPVLEKLGWCSWDAFQIRVSEDNLLKKCEEFQEKGIPVRWILLDDMWGDCTDLEQAAGLDTVQEMLKIMKKSKLKGLEGDPKRFPQGLKHCVKEISSHFGMEVGIWYPLTGYWLGIDEDSPLFSRYRDSLIKNPCGWYQPSWEEGDFYDDWNAFFEQCGISFVKIDNQSSHHFTKGMAPVGEIAKGYHRLLERSAKQHFSGQLINCMGLAPEDMWNRPESAVLRCSDDFQPENRAWFHTHILQCTYNSLWAGAFGWCDYDMWWTDDSQAVKNSLLRAVSGGPVYVSDPLGRSRKEVLEPLVLRDGTVLRCDRVGMPTKDCLFSHEPGRVFKVQNRCGEGGVIAVFNLYDVQARGRVSVSDIDGIEGDQFVLYEHFSKTFSIVSKEGQVEISLSGQDAVKLFLAVPYRNQFAPIGNPEKYISLKTIQLVQGERVRLKEPGRCAVVKKGELLIQEQRS